MPFIPVPNVAAVHVRGSLLGQQTENVLYYLFATQPSVGDLEDLCGAIAGVVADFWVSNLPPEWVGREIYARDLTENPSAEFTDISIIGVNGTYPTGNTLPGNATVALQRSSGLSGRGTRGRIYWQGLSDAVVTGNSVDPAFLANLLGAMDATDAAAAVLAWTPVIVSLFVGDVPRAVGLTFEILTWKYADSLVDSMRRRLQGRGS